ncbi:MAG TPA: pyruvate kinase [Acidimicrobiia bacterium]|nr:pyruvate kinase [Acidimicrobiia bacterium]
MTETLLRRTAAEAALAVPRRAKIVCTIGPATASPERMAGLVAAGMDIARLNFSHGDHFFHAEAYGDIRTASDAAGRAVGVLADLQGPKLRIGWLAGGSVFLADGARTVMTADAGTGEEQGTADRLFTSYAALPEDVRPGDAILLADGTVVLSVLSVAGGDVECAVARGGIIRDHAGMNLPGVSVSTSCLTDKDVEDLRFALRLGVDLVALSFVRGPDDATAVRAVMDEEATRVPVIAKLERPEAVERLEEVIDAFDGVMVARGDLGVETALERVPLVQKRAVELCRRRAKPVIVATEMLESMVVRNRPTRAEASDVANAVLDGADALMLSAETSVGRHPIEAVRTMARIIAASESVPQAPPIRARVERLLPEEEAIAHGAVAVGGTVGAKALVAFTLSGASARLLAAQRPTLPVLAFTPDPRVRSQLALVWGVETFLEPAPADTDEMTARVDRAMLDLGRAAPGDAAVVVAGTPPGTEASTNTLRVHRLGPRS